MAIAAPQLGDLVDENEPRQLAARYGPTPRWQLAVDMSPTTFDDWWSKLVIRRNRRGEVALVIQRPDGQVLLHTKNFYPSGIHRLPTGGVFPGERVWDSVRRETMEETGLRVHMERFLGLVTYEFRCQERHMPFVSYVCLVQADATPPVPEDDHEQITGFRYVPASELRRVADYVHDVKAFLLSDVDWLAEVAEAGDPDLLGRRRDDFLHRCQDLIHTCERAIAGGLEMGDPDIKVEPFDLDQDVIQPLCADWRDRLDRQGITLHEPDIDVPFPLQGDPDVLRRALDHLFQNSAEAWRDLPRERWKGQEVTIEARYVEDRQWVEIVYTDQAGGLDRSIIERLRKGRRIFSTKPGGTGYGLVYVWNTVKNHGGALEIRSDKRTGQTAFHLWLPAPRPPASAAGDRSRAAQPEISEPARLMEEMRPAEMTREPLLADRTGGEIRDAEMFRPSEARPAEEEDQPEATHRARRDDET